MTKKTLYKWNCLGTIACGNRNEVHDYNKVNSETLRPGNSYFSLFCCSIDKSHQNE